VPGRVRRSLARARGTTAGGRFAEARRAGTAAVRAPCRRDGTSLGADIPELLLAGRYDLALAPRTSYPTGFHSRTIRREPLRVALRTTDPLARRKRIKLATLAGRLFEVWPRDMAPGFYDTVAGTCRTAGFEPQLDEQATGNTVWGNLARGRGVALINASLAEQLPRGITLVELAQPAATLTYDAVWHQSGSRPPGGRSKPPPSSPTTRAGCRNRTVTAATHTASGLRPDDRQRAPPVAGLVRIQRPAPKKRPAARPGPRPHPA
jgi:DNA-binding transcriptional LysR family regulator